MILSWLSELQIFKAPKFQRVQFQTLFVRWRLHSFFKAIFSSEFTNLITYEEKRDADKKQTVLLELNVVFVTPKKNNKELKETNATIVEEDWTPKGSNISTILCHNSNCAPILTKAPSFRVRSSSKSSRRNSKHIKEKKENGMMWKWWRNLANMAFHHVPFDRDSRNG